MESTRTIKGFDSLSLNGCLARDLQEAMELLNNMGVAYLDAGEISIARALFVKALRLKANATSVGDTGMFVAGSDSTLYAKASRFHTKVCESVTITHQQPPAYERSVAPLIDVKAIATRAMTEAAKRNPQSFPRDTTASCLLSSYDNDAIKETEHPWLYRRAISLAKRSGKEFSSRRRNPLVSTATVMFNLGLVHHILALANDDYHQPMMTKAHLLYEEALSLATTCLRATSFERPDQVLLLALYNNLAYAAFFTFRYDSSSIYRERLYELALESSSSSHYEFFLLNAMLLIAPTRAAAA